MIPIFLPVMQVPNWFWLNHAYFLLVVCFIPGKICDVACSYIHWHHSTVLLVLSINVLCIIHIFKHGWNMGKFLGLKEWWSSSCNIKHFNYLQFASPCSGVEGCQRYFIVISQDNKQQEMGKTACALSMQVQYLPLRHITLLTQHLQLHNCNFFFTSQLGELCYLSCWIICLW